MAEYTKKKKKKSEDGIMTKLAKSGALGGRAKASAETGSGIYSKKKRDKK
jgi:hypothetical protein